MRLSHLDDVLFIILLRLSKFVNWITLVIAFDFALLTVEERIDTFVVGDGLVPLLEA